jgi:hypothetical protein
MDSILDALGDIFEPIADYTKLHLDQEKIHYFSKWGLYLLKVFIAIYMVGSAIWKMYTNQSYFYMVNENGIFKVIVNIIKFGLAIFMLNQFNLQLNDLAILRKKVAEGEAREIGVAGVGAGTDTDTGLDGFSGWYDMFKTELMLVEDI